ncbi:MAG: AgmX/PglI C-terminal domain-containing protein [Minicystis sp.]
MNAVRFETIPMALGLVAALGCASPGSSLDSADLGSIEVSPSSVTTSAAPRGVPPAVRIEQAERSLDVGRDAAWARTELEGVIQDPASTPDQRDQARLALSRALSALGDKEGAIAAVEKLLAEHADDTRFPLAEQAETRLRMLLTGTAETARRGPAEDARQATPFARALAAYFPVPSEPKRPVEVRLLAFGSNAETSDRLGTFDVPRALRELRREGCPLCEDGLPMRTSAVRNGSWVGIPAQRARLANALVVYYFDLGSGRIPARYDADLPLPSAEIVARLERGEGLVAARERPGAPPVILIAAPREAQLADVEDALSTMKALPFEPVSVPVKATLKPQEIQEVVRASFNSFRGCYEALLHQRPGAAGRVPLAFIIRGDGVVEGVKVDTSEGTLRDARFERCMADATSALVFPATGSREPTTVTYPVMFSPGE